MLEILQYPDPRLKVIARQVEVFDNTVQKIIDAMFLTHYNTKNCAALAATQLDLERPNHITVIDFSPEKNQPLCLVNAKIIESSGKCTEEEGCMSVGGNIYEKITRSAKVKIRAQDRYGKLLEFKADGFMARCIQHELDHLNGIIFLDYLSLRQRNRINKRLIANNLLSKSRII
ncbi:peptide deformylase [Coxiella endosymbiont of Amblyomma americanum]|uniref:peptide deformylase n=1 Tax=Coxiella endosymbiont of Amblyomma americanum TaxID=325775 RepID=UPI0005821A2D|nr:peptide deformylase [Coxiella endosymbiont of Amblyomma americanum]AJC50587.1 peptide deformylase [Coxiella endosymbiont of Amblyomma americanum]AUJ58920.1 peptide deformylase [Coxiella-like endosymbiont of Amblyomma americanum]